MKKSKYKYVYYQKPHGTYKKGMWMAYIKRRNNVRDTNFIIRKHFNTELEAAKAVDIALIKNKEEPVNIYKKQ